ncbi:flagellin domain protein [Clostridium sp. CAG:306]|jgi:flagellin protein|nr:flagellin domain protein [Clostridium sp. CAG:306]
MPIVINTNVPAIKAQNALTRASWGLNQSLERLTTGSKINSAKDDPAGLYYATGLNSQISGVNAAYSNVQMGINMITTASGDLSNINTQLERIKDLATQYSNSSLTDEQKNAIKAEAKQRVEEINRIAEESKLNKLQLLDGSQAGGVRLQIGPNADPATNSLTVTGVFEKADVESLNLVGGSSKFADIDAAFANASTAAQFIDIVQDSADIVTERISTAGIYNARLESITDSLITKNENLQSAVSTVMDADVAAETANYIKNQLLQQTASSLLTQANQAQGVLALKLINALA